MVQDSDQYKQTENSYLISSTAEGNTCYVLQVVGQTKTIKQLVSNNGYSVRCVRD